MSAIKHIQQKIMDIAKERIMNTQKSISQISDEMGFQYPQHFHTLFKKMEGCTPNEYRNEIIKTSDKTKLVLSSFIRRVSYK